MLRAGVAAVQAALAVKTPQKGLKNDPDGDGVNSTPIKEESKVAWLCF